MLDDKTALLLNANFRPLSFYPLSRIKCRDAIKLLYEGVVVLVAEYDEVVRSPSIEMKIPSVVARKTFISVPNNIAFTRFNIFLRDRFVCQYCGEQFQSSDLTFDHVLPKSKGGKTWWNNIVSACHHCNSEKDDKFREPINWPKKPTPRELFLSQAEHPNNFLHETWMDYLYWDSVIEN